jgi:DNA-binding transcriptional LysR family regulator
LPDASYAATKVGALRRVVCGAPGYFERHGVPASPEVLGHHRVIAATAAWSTLDWGFGLDGAAVVRVDPALYCSTNDAAIAAAVAGVGLTRVLAYQIAPELKSGALVTVLEEFEEAPQPLHVAHPEQRHAPAKVRAFVDLVWSI